MNNTVELSHVILMHCRKKQELKQLITIKDYIPIKEKLEVIDKYCKDVIQYKDNKPCFNSVDKFVKGILLIVSLYTNINLQCTYEEFDTLASNYLIDEIIELIPEYNEFRQFLEARFQDFLREPNC